MKKSIVLHSKILFLALLVFSIPYESIAVRGRRPGSRNKAPNHGRYMNPENPSNKGGSVEGIVNGRIGKLRQMLSQEDPHKIVNKMRYARPKEVRRILEQAESQGHLSRVVSYVLENGTNEVKRKVINVFVTGQIKNPAIYQIFINILLGTDRGAERAMIIRAFGEMKTEDPRVHNMLVGILVSREEKDSVRKAAARALRQIELTDFMGIYSLVQALKPGEKDFIKKDIYILLEASSAFMTNRTFRALAKKLGMEGFSTEDKKHMISILRKQEPRDIGTIQWIAKGLNDVSAEVRELTAQVLGEVLRVKISFWEALWYRIGSVVTFNMQNIFVNVKGQIVSRLIDVATNDPEPFVQEAAKEAVRQITGKPFEEIAKMYRPRVPSEDNSNVQDVMDALSRTESTVPIREIRAVEEIRPTLLNGEVVRAQEPGKEVVRTEGQRPVTEEVVGKEGRALTTEDIGKTEGQRPATEKVEDPKIRDRMEELWGKIEEPQSPQVQTDQSPLGGFRIRDTSPQGRGRIISVFGKMRPAVYRIQWMVENGLYDMSSTEVRTLTVQTLGKLGKGIDLKMFNMLWWGKPVTYSENITKDSTNKDIYLYIYGRLLDVAKNDPEPAVRKAAIKTMTQLLRGSLSLSGDLMQILFSDLDVDVKISAIEGLVENWNVTSRAFFPLSQLSGQVRENRTIQRIDLINALVENLYTNSPHLRSRAAQALKEVDAKPREYYYAQELKARELKRIVREFDRSWEIADRSIEPFENLFEVEVFLELHNRGYFVIPKFPVNIHTNHIIDLAVIRPEGRNIGIDCIADHFNLSETGRSGRSYVMERAELEQQGWIFWIITGSNFYTFPSNQINPYTLEDLGRRWRYRQINTGILDRYRTE